MVGVSGYVGRFNFVLIFRLLDFFRLGYFSGVLGKSRSAPVCEAATPESCANSDMSVTVMVIGLYTCICNQGFGVFIHLKLELCAFARKGEHNVYSLFPT